jgi:hypothetical protein
MSRKWEPKKSTVEMQPSRIRREPVSNDKPLTLIKLQAHSREWEIAIGIVGVILFALAINAIWLGLNAFILD